MISQLVTPHCFQNNYIEFNSCDETRTRASVASTMKTRARPIGALTNRYCQRRHRTQACRRWSGSDWPRSPWAEPCSSRHQRSSSSWDSVQGTRRCKCRWGIASLSGSTCPVRIHLEKKRSLLIIWSVSFSFLITKRLDNYDPIIEYSERNPKARLLRDDKRVCVCTEKRHRLHPSRVLYRVNNHHRGARDWGKWF